MVACGTGSMLEAVGPLWYMYDFGFVASIGSTAMGAAAAVAAKHDHFDQVQSACIAGHIHG